MEKILSKKTLHQWKFLRLDQAEIDFANWKISHFEYLSFNDEWDWVMIVAINDKNEIFLVEQYQVWVNKRILVLPRWWVKPWESIEEKANIELQEEVWMKAKKMKYLKEVDIFPWYVKARSFLFLWTDLEQCKIEWDEIETIYVHKIPFKLAIDKIMKWEITDSRTIAWILFVDKYLKN